MPVLTDGGWLIIAALLAGWTVLCAIAYLLVNYLFRGQKKHVIVPWSIFITFIFISFTRLFFRAGDRKNTGNGMETVERLWNQLMTNWDGNAMIKILENHWGVFAMFVAGMIIHWLPVSVKDWYRNLFARTSMAGKVAIVVVTVFIILQFISSELQSFIYFQF
jgi:hypothetical protein